MKWKTMIFSGTALILAGCSTTMKGGEAAVEINSSKEVQLTNVSVNYDTGYFKVTGTLRPTSPVTRRVGHVDVEFVGTDGIVIETVKAEQHIHEFSRSSSRRPTFAVSVALEPSQVKTVRLTHHVDTQQECEL